MRKLLAVLGWLSTMMSGGGAFAAAGDVAAVNASAIAQWRELSRPGTAAQCVRVRPNQPPAKGLGDGVFELVASGPLATQWDFPLKLDLSAAGAVEFDVSFDDISPVCDIPLYFRSGGGWYVTNFPAEDAILSQHVSIRLGANWVEGSPAGWDKVDLFRFRVNRGIAKPVKFRLANIRIVSKDEFVDTPERVAARAERVRKARAESDAYVRSLPGRGGERRFAWCHFGQGLRLPPKPGEQQRRFMGWKEGCRFLKRCGYTDAIVNFCWPDRCCYDSKVVEGREGDPAVDYLELARRECRRNGLKLHGWGACWVAYRKSKEFAAAGRTAVLRNGQPMELWLCPTHPENRRLMVDMLCELADRGCDGVHLDYIRYRGAEMCFCERCRRAFARASGIEIGNWPGDLNAIPGANERWLDFRRANITAVVRAVREHVRRTRPEVEVSVAARASIEGARNGDGQDWVGWAREGLVDFVCPMDYSAVTPMFRATYLEQLAALKGTRAALYPGIGLTCWGKDDGRHVRRFADHILQLRKDGVTGFAVFEAGGDGLDWIDTVGQGPTKPLPHRAKEN